MGIIQTLGMWKERIMRMFKGNIKNEFGVTGITSNAMEDAITDWMDVYQGKASWVDQTKGIKTIKFAKAVCSETARLTNLALGITFDGSRKDYMTEWCERAIMPNLRRWVEYGCASGTIIIKPNGVGADFVTPDRFEIVGKDGNGLIAGIIFEDRYRENDKYYTKQEYHRFFDAKVNYGDGDYKSVKYYQISNRAYVSSNSGELGKEIELSQTKWNTLLPDVSITTKNEVGLNGMMFGVLRMPAANDIDVDSPLGMAIYSDAMEELKDLDIAYSRYSEEVKDSRALELIDRRLVREPGHKVNEEVELDLPKHFIPVSGEGDQEFYQAVERPLKVDERIKGINAQLSYIGYKCGYSNGYFAFDQKTGMVTATQVESDDRRTIQLIKDIRDALQVCLDQVFYAQSVFADLYNLAPVGNYTANYAFGDITYNFEEDKVHHYNLAVRGIYPWEEYYVKFLKYSREEAKALIEQAKSENKADGIEYDEE